MSNLPAAVDPAAVEAAADPAGFVVLACERAKGWLTQAVEQGEIDQIAEFKSQAEAIRIYTTQKQLGKDAELAAAEIVRRAERGLGVALRQGQEDGRVRSQGQGGGPTQPYERHGQRVQVDPRPEATRMSPREVLPNSQERSDIYAVTDGVSDQKFEEAIDEAKGEENLSRANVLRKVKPPSVTDRLKESSRKNGKSSAAVAMRREHMRSLAESGHNAAQIGAKVGLTEETVRRYCAEDGITIRAEAVIGRTRRIDPNRVVNETAVSLEGLAMGVDLIIEEMDRLDPTKVEEWATSLSNSLRTLNRLCKQLKEMTQ